VEDGLADADWANVRAQLQAPLFDSIREVLDQLSNHEWPTLAALNAISEARTIFNIAGLPIRFVQPVQAGSAMQYETQIATTGEIPTRQNLHDLFNALQWLSFPLAKRAINAEHVKRLQNGGLAEAQARSTERDVLTMFDESGVIVASADASLLDLLRRFEWKTLFVTRRDDVIANMRFVLLGHGLMEKSLSPFIGLTGKAMLLNVAADADLDFAGARWLSDAENLKTSRNLAPLPQIGRAHV